MVSEMNESAPIGTANRKRRPARERIIEAATREFVASGFEGARIERICERAKSNPKTLYTHFRSKADVYVAVLEEALAGLRARERTIDVAHAGPLEGLLTLFDFLCEHFRTHPELVRLLSNENIERGQYIRTSGKIAEMSSPVLRMIEVLISRGQEDGSLRRSIEPLTLYVMMAGLAQFYISNVHTLSTIFEFDLGAEDWRDRHNATARTMLAAFLQAPQELSETE